MYCLDSNVIIDFLRGDNLDRRTWMEVSYIVIGIGVLDIFFEESISMLITGIVLILLGFISTKKRK